MERRERSCCTPDVEGAGDAAREFGETASATLRRGVRNSDSTEPRIRPAADGGAERSRLLLRDRPSLRLFLRRSASDGESGEAMVSRDLNSEQKEDFRDTPPGGGNGEGDRCGDGLRGASSVGRVTRPCSVPTSATSLSSSSSSYSLSGFSRIRITSLERFRLLYTSGCEWSRLCRERARVRLLLSLRCLSPSTGAVDTGGAAGRGARSTVTSAVTSRRSRASPAGGGGSATFGAIVSVGPALALSSRHSSTAAAHISGSVSMGRGPQNDVSSSILCGDGERDATDATDNRDTRDVWLKPDSTECAEHCEPTLERRLVRPDTANRAASLPWLSLREWRRESAAGGIGGATGPGPPGAPSRKANSSVEERRSSAPSSRKPSSPEAAGAPAKSASSGELSRESWWLELEAREMSMRGAPKLSPGVDAERARFSGTPSAVAAPVESSRISGSCAGCFVSGLDCKSARSQGGTHKLVVCNPNSVIRERKIPTGGLTSSDTSWSKEAMGAGPRRPPRAAMRRRGRHQPLRRLSLQQQPRYYCRHPATCAPSLTSSNARSLDFGYHYLIKSM